MSEGRASYVRVESPEERHRRLLAAAEDRLDRASLDAAVVAAQAATVDEVHGVLGAISPRAEISIGADLITINAVAARIEAETATARLAIAATRTAELVAACEEILAAAGTTVQVVADVDGGTTVPELEVATSSTESTTDIADTCRRVVGRLPGDAPADVVAKCEQIIHDVAAQRSVDRAGILLASLRLEVQAARLRSDLVANNRDTIENLYRRLDGFDSTAISTLRGFLRGVALDQDLPDDLPVRVDAARALAERDRDRQFALEVTRQVLEEQGYELADDFVTIATTTDGALLALTTFDGYGVRVRERGGQLLFNVVRFGPTEDDAEDITAAEAFCARYAAFASLASSRGLEFDEITHFRPGSGHIEVRNSPSPFAITDTSAGTDEEDSRLRERHH